MYVSRHYEKKHEAEQMQSHHFFSHISKIIEAGLFLVKRTSKENC